MFCSCNWILPVTVGQALVVSSFKNNWSSSELLWTDSDTFLKYIWNVCASRAGQKRSWPVQFPMCVIRMLNKNVRSVVIFFVYTQSILNVTKLINVIALLFLKFVEIHLRQFLNNAKLHLYSQMIFVKSMLRIFFECRNFFVKWLTH